MIMQKNNIFYRVYKLVSHLSHSEQAHIRNELAFNKSNVRLSALFDILCNMKIYNELQIINTLNDKANSKKNINRLVKVIAEILQHHLESSMQKVKIFNLAAQAEILFNKDSIELSKQFADEGLALAQKIGYDMGIIEFHAWYINAYIKHSNLYTEEEVKKHYDYIIEHIKKMEPKYYPIFTSAVLNNIGDKYIVPMDGINSIQINVKDFSNTEVDEQTSIYFVHLNSIYSFYTGEWEVAYNGWKTIYYKIRNVNPSFSNVPKIILIMNLLQFSLLLNNIEEYEIYDRELDEIIGQNGVEKGGVIYYKDIQLAMRLYYYSLLNHALTNHSLLNRIEKLSFEVTQNNRLLFLQILLSYYFFAKEYVKVSSHIIREINQPDFRKYPKNAVYILRWMELISYFECKEIYLFTNRLSLVKRYMEKYRPLHSAENILLEFMKDNFGRRLLRKEAEACIEILESHKNWLRSSFSFFDINRWLRSKI